MSNEDDEKVQFKQVNVLSDHLLRVAEPAHQHFLEDQVKLLEEAFPMNKPGQLGVVESS